MAQARPTETVTYLDFPVADPALLVDDTIELPVQINGKVRGRITVAADATAAIIEQTALGDDKVIAALAGSTRRRSSSCQAAWSTSSPDQRTTQPAARLRGRRCRSRLQHTRTDARASSIVRSRCPPSASINSCCPVSVVASISRRLTTLGGEVIGVVDPASMAQPRHSEREGLGVESAGRRVAADGVAEPHLREDVHLGASESPTQRTRPVGVAAMLAYELGTSPESPKGSSGTGNDWCGEQRPRPWFDHVHRVDQEIAGIADVGLVYVDSCRSKSGGCAGGAGLENLLTGRDGAGVPVDGRQQFEREHTERRDDDRRIDVGAQRWARPHT